MKKSLTRYLPILLVIFLAACASQPPAQAGVDLPGFWMGLWHGIAAPIAWIGEMFMDHRIYAFPNNGGWYDSGFMIGISFWGGGGAAASS